MHHHSDYSERRTCGRAAGGGAERPGSPFAQGALRATCLGATNYPCFMVPTPRCSVIRARWELSSCAARRRGVSVRGKPGVCMLGGRQGLLKFSI